MITAMLQSLAPLRTTCGCINCPVPRIECRPGEGIRRRDWFAGAHVPGLGTARDDHLVTLSDNSPWSGLLPIASHIEDGELCDILKALCRWGGGGWGGFFIPQSLFSSFCIKEPITYYFTDLVRKEGGRYHHLHNSSLAKTNPTNLHFSWTKGEMFYVQNQHFKHFLSIFSPFGASTTLAVGCEQAPRHGLQPHHLSKAEKVKYT